MNHETTIIKPELPGGFRDYPPEEMIPRQKMLDTIREVYEQFGFDPLDTPIIERLDVLTGGNKDFNMHLFHTGIVTGLQEPKAESFMETAIRFDLTIALARFIATHPHLPTPFKRYQIGIVARGERQQQGRYRAFTQCDVDVVGSDSLLADVEIIQVMYSVMHELGVNEFVIRINNRKILSGLAELLGFSTPVERMKEVLRILDKLEKAGWHEVALELQRPQKDSQDTAAPALSSTAVDKIREFVHLSGDSKELLLVLEKWFQKQSTGVQGVHELGTIVQSLKNAHIPEKNWKIDLSIARGLDYYTGTVFETQLTVMPEVGSVISGGRYDNLVNRFLPNVYMPAVGTSIGVDRLFFALKKLNKLTEQKTTTRALIANFEPDLEADYLLLAKELRNGGINTRVHLDSSQSLKDQLAYASKLEIPFAVLLGQNEKERGEVILKDMTTRKQVQIPQSQLVSEIRKSYPPAISLQSASCMHICE